MLKIVFISLMLLALPIVSDAYESKCMKLYFANDYKGAIIEGNKDIKKKRNDFEPRFCLGASYTKTGQIDLALDQLFIAEKLFRNESELSDIYNLIGNNYADKNELDNAMIYYNRCLNIAIRNNDTKRQASTLNNIGNVYSSKSDLNKSLEYFLKSAELQNDNDKASAYNGIAFIYSRKSDHIKAEEYMKKSIAIDEKTGDSLGEAMHTLNLGFIYIIANNNTDAHKYLLDGTSKIIRIGNKQWESQAYAYLGLYYKNINNTDEAVKYYNKALKLAKSIGSTRISEDVTLAIKELEYKTAYIKEMKKSVDELNKKTPQLSEDGSMRFDKYEFNDNIFASYITMMNVKANEVDKNELQNTTNELIKSICGDTETRKAINYGVSYKYEMSDIDKKSVVSVTIDSHMCVGIVANK